jgi:aryl-alcohol dehydrogenase-like predicted oxidoreductase
MDQLTDNLGALDVEIDDEMLQKIDEIVPPETNL